MWTRVTLNTGDTIIVNLDQLIAIRPNNSTNGSLLITVAVDDNGKPVRYSVKENPSQVLEAAFPKSYPVSR